MQKGLKKALVGMIILLLPLGFGRAAEDTIAVEIREILCNPFLTTGDQDGLLRFWLEWAWTHPSSSLAELALRLARGIDRDELSSATLGTEGARRFLAAQSANPFAEDVAMAMVGEGLAAGGKLREALAHHRTRGFLETWWICGPFGPYGSADFDHPFPPESEIDLEKPVKSFRGLLSWLAVPPSLAIPQLDPWLFLHPPQGVAYLVTQGRVEEAAEVLFHLQTAMLCRFFLDGKEVATLDFRMEERPRELFLKATLQPGIHRILLKVYPWKGARALSLRLLDRGGSPFPSWTPEGGAQRVALSGSEVQAVQEGGDLLLRLRERYPLASRAALPANGTDSSHASFNATDAATSSSPPPSAVSFNAAGYAALATLYAEQGMTDTALSYASLAVEAEPTNPYWHFLQAEYALRAEEQSTLWRVNQALSAYSRALAFAPEFLVARLAIARLRGEQDRLSEALETCESILQQANPEEGGKGRRCLGAYRLRAKLAIQAGWTDFAQRWIQEALEVFPTSAAIHAVAEEWARKENDPAAVEAACRGQVEANASRWSIRKAWVEALVDLGRYDEALDALQVWKEVFPDQPEIHHLSARVYRMAERYEEATAALRQAIALRPRDEGLWRDLGDLHFQEGKIVDAWIAYAKSLALRPEQHPLRRLLADLLADPALTEAIEEARRKERDKGGKEEDDLELVSPRAFWLPYALNAEAELERIASLALEGSTARVVDQTVVEIYRDGSYQEYTHQVQKILTERGIAKAGTVHFRGELLAACTHLPGGMKVEPVRLPGRQELVMPAIQPGVAVEYAFLDAFPAPRDRCAMLPKWYFRSPSDEEEFLLSQYIVRAPRDYPLLAGIRNMGGEVEFQKFEHLPPRAARVDAASTEATSSPLSSSSDGSGEKTSQTVEGGSAESSEETILDPFVTYVWTARRMKRPFHEPEATAIEERLPFVEIGGSREWQAVNRAIRNEYLGRVRVTRAIREEAKRLASGATSPRERIERFHRFVCREITVETSGVPANQVLEQQYGSRLLLLFALLRADGWDPLYVAARPPQTLLPAPNWDLPSSEVFPLRLLAVNLSQGETLWLDTRFRYLGCGKLLEDLSGGTAFITGKEGGTFFTLPPQSPHDYGVYENQTIFLPSEGDSLRIEGEREVCGIEGERLKERMIEAEDRIRNDALEERLGKVWPGITVHANTASLGAAKRGGYYETYKASVAGAWEKRQQGVFGIPLGLSPLGLAPGGGEPSPHRRTDYHLQRFVVGEDTLRICLPPQATVLRLPRGRTLKTAFGDYSLHVQWGEGEVKIVRRYQFLPQRIPVSEWDPFLRLLEEIRALEEQRLLWRRAAP